MLAYRRRNRQNWYFFCIKLPKRGIPPSAIFFIKFGLGEGVPGPYPHTKFHCSGFQKCGPTAPQIVAKNRNFWYKFTHVGKFCGSTEKVEYRCTTTNLPVCNDTIIVLKITLLHSVSVITNFVIPKRDKQKNITLFRLQPARDPRSPPYLAW